MGQSNRMKFFVCNGKMYFNPLENETDEGSFLYVYDGVNVQKFAINGSDFSNPSNFFNWNNTLVFNAETNSYGSELWTSNGTFEGTKMIKDIHAGTESSNANHFCVMGNQLYFSAADTLSNVELWVTDGTEAGTKKVKEINTNAGNTRQSSPSGMTTFKNLLYFSARPGLSQTYLFSSDGTEANTKQLDADLIANFSPSFNPEVADLVALEDALLFVANYSNSHKMLYKVYFTLAAPTALDATDIDEQSFTAHWTSVEGAESYLLYVSKQSDFSTCIDGYNGLSVTGTSQQVMVTDNNTTYYYRIVALNNSDTSAYSNVISVEMKSSICTTPHSSIKAFPNPIVDEVAIITVNEIIKRVDFFDVSGKKVYSQSFNDKYVRINTASLPAGFYTAKIYFSKSFVNHKLVKY
jgi:ELWxxDGT repeat protein